MWQRRNACARGGSVRMRRGGWTSSTGAPTFADNPPKPFTTTEFRCAVMNKAGAYRTTLSALVVYPITTKTQSTLTVDPSGYNLQKTNGVQNDGMKQNHDSFVHVLSKLEWTSI